MEINKIYNESCLETMARMPEEFVDLVLTSPFYNTSRPSANDRYNSRYATYIDKISNKDYICFIVDLFNQFDRIVKKDGCVLFNISYSAENTDLIWLVIAEVINKTNFTTSDCIVWKKTHALPNNMSKNKLTRICEYIFVFCRDSEIQTFFMDKAIISKRKSGQANYENASNFIEAKNNDLSTDLNKATFSSELVRKLLKIYAPKNALIYDSFMGTGTTAIGAIEENCHFIGSEICTKQCEFAEARIKEAKSQLKLF